MKRLENLLDLLVDSSGRFIISLMIGILLFHLLLLGTLEVPYIILTKSIYSSVKH